jgi:hypothetical protein
MRPTPSRLASNLTLGVLVSMALVQAGAAMEVDGRDRDLHLRVTRAGVHRPDTDGGHVVGDVEGAALTVAEQATADQGLATRPEAAYAPPAAPTDFLWLSPLAAVAPATAAATAPARGRAPPAA